MLTRFFNKTNPSNYFLLIFLLALNPIIYLTINYIKEKKPLNLFINLGAFFCVLISFFIINSIIRKLNLHKQHLLGGFLFVFFTYFIPELFNNIKVALVLCFMSFALYRLLISKVTKAAIFDFSLLTLLASFFNYWALVFLLFLIIYIMFFKKFDYKNLLIPFVAFFTVFFITFAIDIIFKLDLKETFFNINSVQLNVEHFSNINQRIVFSMLISFIMFFTVLYFFQSEHIPSNIKPYYNLFLIFLLVSILFFLIDVNKNNESLIFLILPITVFGGRYLENLKDKRLKEFISWVFLITAISLYIVSL